ncbi:MAG: hypothetical protein QM729_19535 [Solirubrobacterales bacterium]
MKALPSGKLLVSGYLRNQIVLYRLTANGRRDPSFGGGDGKVTVGSGKGENGYGPIPAPFAVERGGRIILAGADFTGSILNGESVVLVRLLADGRRDPTFRRTIFIERAPIDADEPIPRKHVEYYAFDPQGLAVDAKGRIVIVGSELAPYVRGQKEPGYQFFAARRFLPNGRRDQTFGEGGVFPTNPPGSKGYAHAAVTAGDGQVVAGGWIQLERGGGISRGNTAMLLTRYR